MSLLGAGSNNSYQLGVMSDSTDNNGDRNVSTITEIPHVANNIKCITAGWSHTVIVTNDGRVLATGDDTGFRIGSESRIIYHEFTEIKISDEKIVSAAAGTRFTLYLTEYRHVILCHQNSIGERIGLLGNNRAVSAFAGRKYGAIVDEDGNVYILNKKDPHAELMKFSFPLQPVDVTCCDSFCIVLLKDHSTFGNGSLNSNRPEFIRVESLVNQKIKKIVGYSNTCLALSEEGTAFSYGSNSFGQFGNGTTQKNFSRFNIISALSEMKVKDIACSNHSLFLTDNGELYGCGNNRKAQILYGPLDLILSPQLIMKNKDITAICAGYNHTLVICKVKKENPSRIFFHSTVYHDSITNQQSDKINRAEHDISSIIQENIELKSRVVKLENKMNSLEQQNEELKNELKKVKDILVEIINEAL